MRLKDFHVSSDFRTHWALAKGHLKLSLTLTIEHNTANGVEGEPEKEATDVDHRNVPHVDLRHHWNGQS